MICLQSRHYVLFKSDSEIYTFNNFLIYLVSLRALDKTKTVRKVEDEEHTSRVYCLSDKTHFGLLVLHHCVSDSGAQSKCKLVKTTKRKSLRVTKAN